MSSGSKAPGDPSETLGYLVKQAQQRLSAAVDAALEPTGIDRKEFAVLRVLAGSEPRSQQAVAATLGIDPTTMVGLIDALQSKRIVSRAPDPADRRRNVIELTPIGRTMYREAGTAHAAAEAKFLAPLGTSAAEQFRWALRVLHEHATGPAGA